MTAWAVTIDDTVIVGDKEWIQVSLFTDVSWNTLDDMFDSNGRWETGSTTVKGYDITQYTWADVDDVKELFNLHTGVDLVGTNKYTEPNSKWAPEFIAQFDPTYDFFGSRGVNGLTRDSVSAQSDYAYSGYLLDRPQSYDADLMDVSNSFYKDYYHPVVGVWFYKSTAVPEPSTAILFGLGILAITGRKRQRVT